jgi:hypothetical protein
MANMSLVKHQDSPCEAHSQAESVCFFLKVLPSEARRGANRGQETQLRRKDFYGVR